MVLEKISGKLKKMVFSSFEPTFHVFAGYTINKNLEEMKKEGSITEFDSRTSRPEKHHYIAEIELSMTRRQAKEGISNLVKNLPISLKGGDSEWMRKKERDM